MFLCTSRIWTLPFLQAFAICSEWVSSILPYSTYLLKTYEDRDRAFFCGVLICGLRACGICARTFAYVCKSCQGAFVTGGRYIRTIFSLNMTRGCCVSWILLSATKSSVRITGFDEAEINAKCALTKKDTWAECLTSGAWCWHVELL